VERPLLERLGLLGDCCVLRVLLLLRLRKKGLLVGADLLPRRCLGQMSLDY